MKHLLVTNDFPPKVGGIQSYLWELWRRLPAADTTVLTTAFAGSAGFDGAQPFRIERTSSRALWPTRGLAARIDRLADQVEAEVVLLDPALPLGRLGPRLERPYGVVLHGAELAIPAHLPGVRGELARVLRGALVVVAAGAYPAAEAERVLGGSSRTALVPPGVDVDRFRPLDDAARDQARARFGVETDRQLVVSVSRLVPRKGMDTLIKASAEVARDHPALCVLIGGTGRDRRRLQRIVDRSHAPVRLVGRIPDDELPTLVGCADVFAMLCRNRWGGLEQEGFGIVFLEAAACAVPQVAGRSGGSSDAVEHGVTGLVVDEPQSVSEAAGALRWILGDGDLRASMAEASRRRAVEHFTYDSLALQLHKALLSAVDPR